jgi:hypothetical protein
MWAMWWGRGTQRQEDQLCKEREASSREEESLRNDQRTTLQRRSDQERQAKDRSSEGDHSKAIERNTQKRAAVYSYANHLARGSKKPRIETTKGEEAGVRNPGFFEVVVQKAHKDDEDQQGFDRSLWQPCSKGDTAADARIQELELELHILEEELKNGEESGDSDPGGVAVFQKDDKDDENQQGFNRSLLRRDAADIRLRKLEQGLLRKLEQEIHIVEEELKNENQPLCEEDEKLYANAVHKTTREATARASGTYRA